MKKQSPSLSTAIFLLGWTAFISAIVIKSLLEGSFRYGSHRTGIAIVSPESHPYFYWGWLGFWILMCLWLGSMGVKEFSGYLRKRKRD